MKKALVLLLSSLIFTACTWVTLTDEGKGVRVVTMDHVKTCTQKGQVQVSLKDKIAGFDRDEEKVRQELETLARNSAIDLEGDSIVPISGVKDGKQTFAVYQCGAEGTP